MNRMHHIREDEIERCTTAYIPHHLLHKCANYQQSSLAQKAITSVARDICTTLHAGMSRLPLPNCTPDIIKSLSPETFEARIKKIEALMKRLAWTEWKKCSSPSCGLDEVCYTAIWPFGSQQDHDRPSCKNGTAMMEPSSMGYWWDGEQRVEKMLKKKEEEGGGGEVVRKVEVEEF